jgi:hypothetical protein
MFGLSKLWGYAAALVVGALAIIGSFLSGRSAGKDEAELESRDAVADAEAEGHKVLTDRLDKEGEAVEKAHKRTKRRRFN